MPTKTRINYRHRSDFEVKMVGPKAIPIGNIESLSWFPLKLDEETGFTNVAVSFKLNDLPDRMKVFPKDLLNASIVGKIQGRTLGISESIQQLKIVPGTKKELNEKGEPIEVINEIPDEFEVGKIYTFEGKMLLDDEQDDIPTNKKKMKSFKNRF